MPGREEESGLPSQPRDAVEQVTSPAAVVPVMEMRGVSKAFGSIQALDDVSLDLVAGEIHALLGENGAGKSTLIKVMTGVNQPDVGEILIDGEPRRIHSAFDAQTYAVAAIYQEPMVFPDLTVAENIFIGHRDRGRVVNRRRMREQADAVLGRLDVQMDVSQPARGLTLAQQQTVEIAKALSLNVRVLIMDEPTASLSAHEVAQLFATVERLRRQGVAILFISHRLEEVFQVADRITIMRDGKRISTTPRSELTVPEAIRQMVGRAVVEFYKRTPSHPGAVVLQVEDLAVEGAFEGITFDLRAGEVLGFAGLVGARRTDVGLALFGIAPAQSGRILLDGVETRIRSPRDAMAHGIAYTTEDRRGLGLIFPQSIAANITLPTLDRFLNRAGLIRAAEERSVAEQFRERLSIRAPSVATPASSLSGGNQQKVVLSKWLQTKPRILILDEPTRGIDVGAKVEVHRLVDDLVAEGLAIILISSDLPELLPMSDRILVMREGRQMAILDAVGTTSETVLTWAMGQADMLAVAADPRADDGAARAARVTVAGRRYPVGRLSDSILRRVRPDQIRELVTVLVIVLLVAFFSTQIDNYLGARTFLRVSTSLPIVAVMAVGQVLVILTRNIDLSVGSQVGMVAYMLGSLMGSTTDLDPFVLVAIGMALGALMGAINGVIVAYGRVPAIITTLGTLAIYRVVLIELGEARTVTTTGFPGWLLDFPSTSLVMVGDFDIRLVFGVTLAAVLVGQVLLRYLPYGRRLYAIGSNPDAARTAGLPMQRDVFWAFTLCGAMSGLAGFLYLARFGNITAVAGQGLELAVIAAVVVGGVNIFGGSGSMIGAFLGVILIEVLQQSLLRWIGISEFVRDFLLGLLILLAVASDKIILGRIHDAWVRVRRRDDAAAREAREQAIEVTGGS